MSSAVRVKRSPSSKPRSFSRTVSAKKRNKECEYVCSTVYQGLEIRCALFSPTPKIASEDFVNEYLIPNLQLNLAPLEIEVQVWPIVGGRKVQSFSLVADSSAKARRASKSTNTYNRRLVGVPPKS